MQKRKVLSLEGKSEGVMDDDSGESIEPIEEVPPKEPGENQGRPEAYLMTQTAYSESQWGSYKCCLKD